MGRERCRLRGPGAELGETSWGGGSLSKSPPGTFAVDIPCRPPSASLYSALVSVRRTVIKRLLAALLVLGLSVPLFAATANAPTSTTGASIHAYTLLLKAAQGNPNVEVWVNTASGVYHCPGTRWYGKTKHGEYMTQAEAQKKGFRPAYGKVCQ